MRIIISCICCDGISANSSDTEKKGKFLAWLDIEQCPMNCDWS